MLTSDLSNTEMMLMLRHQQGMNVHRHGLYDALDRNECETRKMVVEEEEEDHIAMEVVNLQSKHVACDGLLLHIPEEQWSSHTVAMDHSNHHDCHSPNPTLCGIVCDRNENTFSPILITPGQSSHPLISPQSFVPITSSLQTLDTHVSKDAFTHSPRCHTSLNSVSPLIISTTSPVVGPTFLRAPQRRSPAPLAALAAYDHDNSLATFLTLLSRPGTPFNVQLENIGLMMVSESVKGDSPILSRCNSQSSINSLAPELSSLPSYRSPRIRRARPSCQHLAECSAIQPLCVETAPAPVF